ncbi:MAG: UbiA family prenyltransferase, partial [Rudaea sp.]
AALKRSALSWVAYVTAYPSLPVWVWASLGRFDNGLLVVYLLAGPLALAFHFVNQLRDYDQDAAMGIKSLIQRLGKATSVRACRYLLVIAPVPLLAWGLVSQTGVSGWVAIFAAVIAYVKLVILVLPQPGPGSPPEGFRTMFQRLQFAGPLLLLGWILAGQT